MEKDNNIKSELEELAPLLSELDKKEGYQVPFNFFEKLEEEIMEEVTPNPHSTVQETPVAPRRSWRAIFGLKPAYRFGLALASIAVIVVIGSQLMDSSSEQDQDFATIWEEVSLTEVEKYVVSNIEDFDLEELDFQPEGKVNVLDGIQLDLEDLNEYIEAEDIFEDLDENALNELL
ncbi:MAG: hypothetical protein AAF598_06570 [Bacteroidota bacterium]